MEQENLSLLDMLERHRTDGSVPMHMPGHKRNTVLAPFLKALRADLDLTEIDEFDDLHAPEGILKEGMDRAARLWGSDRAFYLVNGSTAGILAGVRAAVHRGDRVLVARNCHKSVYHALALCGVEPVFLSPPATPDYGIAASLPPERVEQALEARPDIRLVILTSPTYAGVISDVAAICRAAHRKGVPVLVDEAHGSHLGFSPYFPSGAVSAGADWVIQSLHKTLPSLTQTALLHVSGDLASPEETARQLGIFQTSSPSYLLMASIDGCVRLLETNRGELFRTWEENLRAFDREILDLTNLRVFRHGDRTEQCVPGVFAFDPSKLVVSTRHSALTGVELQKRLREQYHIELEMATTDYALAMTGPGDTLDTMKKLAAALLELDREFGGCEQREPAEPAAIPVPKRACPLEQALVSDREEIPEEQAVGRISACYVWAYPPGIPLVTPGERWDGVLVEKLRDLERSGVRVLRTTGEKPGRLAVLREGEDSPNCD